MRIAEIGNPILRTRANGVPDVKSPATQTLIDDLLATVGKVNGVGLAAPQISQSKRIFIIASHPNPRYPNAPFMEPTAVINPVILSHTGDLVKDWEGCLSIPGIRALVPRYAEVTVSYTDRTGTSVKRRFTDFIARIFQHENDHLDGILFLDRITSSKEIISEYEYQKLLAAH